MRAEKRNTLRGAGFVLKLTADGGQKKQLSALWRTQLMYCFLDKMAEWGYRFTSFSANAGQQTFFFNEEKPVMNTLFGAI